MAEALSPSEPVEEMNPAVENGTPMLTKMFKAKHLFVELHEFKDDGWCETRRWNHGLEEEFVPKTRSDGSMSRSRSWTRPHLPSMSLFGMMALRDALCPELVVLDIVDDLGTFEPIANAILRGLEQTNRITSQDVPRAFEALMSNLRKKDNAVTARKRTEANLTNGEFTLARVVSEDSDLASNDPLCPEAEEETVHILIGGVEWMRSDVVGIVRLTNSVETGLEEANNDSENSTTRFVVMIFGPHHSEQPNRHTEMGEAFAGLLQDEDLAGLFYASSTPEEIVNAVNQRFWKLQLIPKTSLPTTEGIKKRAQGMLKQMTAVKQLTANFTDHATKWKKKQENPFKRGFSVNALISAAQRFAMPLICGVLFAIVVANVDPEGYDHWAGYGHGAASSAASGSASGVAASGSASGVATSGCHHPERPNVFGLEIKGHGVTLHFIVNDIFMVLFFGLAVKELVEAFQPGGSLYPPTRTTVNVLTGTVGGVVGPVAAYVGALALCSALGLLDDDYSFGTYVYGWGIPTATDISVAWVAALCVFGPGHPAINYLLLLAIVDDGIGLLIIAFAYPDPANPLQPQWLVLIVVAMIISFLLRRIRCADWPIYVAIAGPVSWCGLLFTGLHPSLALVFVVPFMPVHIEETKHKAALSGELLHEDDHAEHHRHHHSRSPLNEFEHATKLFADFAVLSSFGAVNAGVQLNSIGALTGAVVIALVAGKPLGIVVASEIAGCCKCPPPEGMTRGSVLGVGVIASAGLTVSLFISGEAFKEYPVLGDQAKLGALLSVFAALALVVHSIVKGFFERPKAICEDDIEVCTQGEEHFEEDLEQVIVESTVRSLHVIHHALKAVENKAAISVNETRDELAKLEGRRTPKGAQSATPGPWLATQQDERPPQIDQAPSAPQRFCFGQIEEAPAASQSDRFAQYEKAPAASQSDRFAQYETDPASKEHIETVSL